MGTKWRSSWMVPHHLHLHLQLHLQFLQHRPRLLTSTGVLTISAWHPVVVCRRRSVGPCAGRRSTDAQTAFACCRAMVLCGRGHVQAHLQRLLERLSWSSPFLARFSSLEPPPCIVLLIRAINLTLSFSAT